MFALANAVMHNLNATTPINVFQRIGFVMEVTTVLMEVMKILKHVNQVVRKHAVRSSLCAHLQQRNTHTVDVFQSHGDVILIMTVLMGVMKQTALITNVGEVRKVT